MVAYAHIDGRRSL